MRFKTDVLTTIIAWLLGTIGLCLHIEKKLCGQALWMLFSALSMIALKVRKRSLCSLRTWWCLPSWREQRSRERIGACHFSRLSLLLASSLIIAALPVPRFAGEKLQATQAKCNVVHNFNRGYFTCTTEIPFKIACTRIIFLIQTLILLILALSLWVESCLNLSDRGTWSWEFNRRSSNHDCNGNENVTNTQN